MPTRVTKKRPPHIAEGFAQRFINARTDAGYSKTEVAVLTSNLVSVRSQYDWEKGKSYPALGPPIRAVAEVLDVPLAWLLRGDESARPRANGRGDDPWSRS